MKNFFKLLPALSVFVLTGCFGLFGKEETGEISVDFEKSFFTKAQQPLPSPDDFILTVTDASGNEIYSGKYGESPEKFEVKAGSYTITALSREFDEPLFESPQYGDSQTVTVSSGQSVNVTLVCKQTNCGVRLDLDSSFRKVFPEGVLYLNGSGGTLMYGYAESRMAYFNPGGLVLSIYNAGEEAVLCTRTLEAQQMLTIKLSAVDTQSSGGVALQIDSSRMWLSENLVIGESGGEADALTVTEARSHIGESDVWVTGYVVGVAVNTGKFSFAPPFSKNTNIVIGLRSTSTDADYLLSVELPKGDVRDGLNLVDNPGILGTKLLLKGTLVEAYYGIPGLKTVTDFKL